MLHYYDKRKYLVFFFIILSFCVYPQMKDGYRKKYLQKADELYEYGDYFNALKLYDTLLINHEHNNELNFKAGVCHYNIKRYRKQSLRYFEKIGVTYSNNELHYYLGNLYHQKKDFERAMEQFQKYQSGISSESEHNKKEIFFLINKVLEAKIFESSPDPSVHVENMGEIFNTKYSEYGPLIPADESFMIFTSRRNNSTGGLKDPYGDYFEDIYISKKVNNAWTEPVSISPNINTIGHDAATGLSADGHKLLIYRTDEKQTGGDIYYSLSDDIIWSLPKPLEEDINTKEYLESSACYAPDGETIFFSSNRPGGFGGKDLYMIKKLPNGKWGLPFNLGPHVNTEYDEDAPFIHPKGNILFFCSQGHQNMGGYDNFKTIFNDEGRFTEAKNLGYPINTVEDDICFVLNTNGNVGYFSSERANGFGDKDIYKVSFYNENLNIDVVHSYLLGEDSLYIKKAEITLIDKEKMKVEGVYRPNEMTGRFIMIVEPGREYLLLIKAPGYKVYSESFICDGTELVKFKMKKDN